MTRGYSGVACQLLFSRFSTLFQALNISLIRTVFCAQTSPNFPAIPAPVASHGGASDGPRAQHRPQLLTENLVICGDGTGNEISENISNVLKLYRCLRKTDRTQPRQFVFCDPGVGSVTGTRKHHRAPVNGPLTNAA
ncbi:phospholipase effector Tle1 domain-containing protein [Bradyrhizobium arachidis]|uniref:phospholipase effector Tle1 domain-containing protein n=1 Tax=Bradyrhizobium arachidis TaxID=858423 RepID=UPI003D315B7F